MEENMDDRQKWLELERVSIPFLKDCRARYTPSTVRSVERALRFLMERRPDLPFRPEDLLKDEEARWSRSTRKMLRHGIVLFGRWAERQYGFVVLQS